MNSADLHTSLKPSSKQKTLLAYVATATSAIMLLLLTSLDSPLTTLYSFGDIQMYMDIAREMLNGKVMYAGIYDHKGPWLYFLYLPAMFFDPWGSFGVFVTECVVFIAFMLVICRFCIRCQIKPSIAAFSTVIASLSICTALFFVPGQAEYIALPFLSSALCAFIECVQHDRALTRAEALVIGLGCGWCFWAKFTICAFYALLCICLVWHYTRHLHTLKLMWRHIGLVLAGMVAMTVPVAVYFAASGDVLLPVREYLAANISGGYLGAEGEDTSLLYYCIAAVLLPYGAIALGIGFVQTYFSKHSLIPKSAVRASLFIAAGYLLFFISLGRAAAQYLMLEYAFLPLWALALGTWLTSNRFKNKAVVVLLTATISVFAMSIGLSTMADIGSGVFTQSERPQAAQLVAEKVEPNSNLYLYRVWDQGYYAASKSYSAGSTIGCYKLNYALQRQDGELDVLLQNKGADYILISDKAMQDKSIVLEEAGYKLILSFEADNQGVLHLYSAKQ